MTRYADVIIVYLEADSAIASRREAPAPQSARRLLHFLHW